MARGVNKVILVGNLGADPDTRFTGSGMAITNLRLATTEQRTDKQTGEKQDHTEWHRVVLFGKLGEIANEYLKKGRQVYIEGTLRTSKYTDKEGVERYSTEIIGNDMQMIGSGTQSESRPAKRQERPATKHADASNGDRATGGFQDDEIPFHSIPRRQLW